MRAASRLWLKKAVRLLGGLVGLYILVCLAVFLGQRRLIYFPSAELFLLPAGFEAWREAGTGELQGYKRQGLSDVCLFFLHGNAGNARGWAHATVDFPGDVFVLEYPGYGERAGGPSEEALKSAAVAGFDAEVRHYRTVILCGQSLGCGVAPAVLEKQPAGIGALVLITPFTSASDMAAAQFPFLPTALMLKDRFPLFEAWRAYAGPSFVVIAGNDDVIPAKLSSRYIQAQTARHQVAVIPNVRHNDVRPSAAFWRKVIGAAQGQDSSQSTAPGRPTTPSGAPRRTSASSPPPSIRWNFALETCWFHMKSRLVAMRRSMPTLGVDVGEGQAHRGRSPSSSTR